MKYSTLIQGEGVLLSHEQLLLKLAPGGLPDSLLPGGPRLCQDAADRTPPLASLGTASLRHDGGWLLRRPGTGFKGAFHRLKSCLQDGQHNKLKVLQADRVQDLCKQTAPASISSRRKYVRSGHQAACNVQSYGHTPALEIALTACCCDG